ncbi:biotin-dependent carboxyltransferase family protein [Shimazuella kribbensis]|uniref:5-oxoprolinase subunit C family protein n=1 Tax=Shimazuella kribbensis TaxID=139808 RepID=UPI00041ECB2F|nr:biotin-dependent carboxyltransferase family protein [Shimazuella kribbensis]
MSIKVNNPGLLTSIQDLGRYGFQKYGVVVSGAMDVNSLRIANLLVGNQEGEAALEITLMGASFLVEEDLLISVTGGDLSPAIGQESLPLWRPVYVRKGSVLRFPACRSGCRAYMSVAGGFAIEDVMKSKSTYLRGKIGGYRGRALKTADTLSCNKMPKRAIRLLQQLKKRAGSYSFATVNWYVSSESFVNISKSPEIRVLRGGEFDRFTSSSQRQFFEQDFRISPKSDRMGYRIEGPSLQTEGSFDLISEAVSNGTIQVPKDGNPIILLADRQTTGGYPKIAQVATVDLPLLAQVKPGERIRFKEITRNEAEQLYLEQERQMKQLSAGLLLKET